MHTPLMRVFVGMIIPILFMFTPFRTLAMTCDDNLGDRSQVYLRLVRLISRGEPTRVASFIHKTLAIKPLANPFEPTTAEFKFFEKFYKDLTVADDETAKIFRQGILVLMSFEECFYLAQLTQDQEIPSARKP